MSESITPENKENPDEDNTPLAEDEEYQHVEEEIEVDEDGNEIKPDSTQSSEEFPDWVNGKREHSRPRRHKKRIKVQKKIKVKQKSKKRKYKKVLERVVWTLIIIGFIASMSILIKELDIVDQNAKKKKKVMNQLHQDKEIALITHHHSTQNFLKTTFVFS